ncbi:recombinase family protein [Streptomyces sp. WM6378]|uniref:recombinase family protein n=1 Tax=Streptomyces sp. WM6378 TaxID=1415557 RepID=UPI00099B65FE|nr:recombinase family protein [Streptomyces sp. WM6378]
MTRFAFAGRCSTEDLQDPEASKNWQLLRAKGLIEPVGGQIVAEYFDSGHSRALPWKRRPQAAALLQDLRNPQRGFDAVVIGEPQRTFYGNQFGNTFPLFVHFHVPLWVPEVGGPIDPDNEAHDLVMSVFGGMSKGERNRIKIRVRTATASQAQLEGRYLGGRPPYGYTLEDAGPHPNPAKAADGKRLQRLVPDPVSAPIVQRIFSEYLRGKGYLAIAIGLTLDSIPCPSAHDRARNPHRDGLAWSKSAVAAILANPRYTGHEIWNKQRKDEVLLDIDDITLGHRTKQSWNKPDQWIWSAQPVHEPLVSLDDFKAAQAQRSSRHQQRDHPRPPRTTTHPYVLRGRIHCSICRRTMQGSFNNGHPHYRCRYTAEYARTRALDHPPTIYVREDAVLPRLDSWIAQSFAPARLDRALHELQRSQENTLTTAPALEVARITIADCDRRIAHYRAGLDRGTDPELITRWITQTQAEKAAAQRQLNETDQAQRTVLTEDQIRELVEQLGSIHAALATAAPEDKQQLYLALGLKLTYYAKERIVTVESQPALLCAHALCPRGNTSHRHTPLVSGEIALAR